MPWWLLGLFGLVHRWELRDALGAVVNVRCNKLQEGLRLVRVFQAQGYAVTRGPVPEPERDQ